MKTLWLLTIGLVLTLIVVGIFMWTTRRQECHEKEENQSPSPRNVKQCRKCNHDPCQCPNVPPPIIAGLQNKSKKSTLAPLQEYKGKAKAVKTRTGQYIVVLKPTKGPNDVKACAHEVNSFAKVDDAQVGALYQYGFSGYQLSATPEQIAEIRKHPTVQSIEIDVVVDHCGGDDEKKTTHFVKHKKSNVVPQPPAPRIMLGSDAPTYDAVPTTNKQKAIDASVPWGADQIGACLNPLNLCSGNGNVPDVHVYVIDTGITLTNSKLNVVENRSFVTGDVSGGADGHGHGTFVSSILGAKDNGINYVGVAPGVKLHAFKGLNSSGSGTLSDITSAVEAVIVAKIATPNVPMIINLSLGAYVGTSSYTALDNAIVSATKQNIHVVIAAGNSSTDARFFTPAHVTQALTVGSYAKNRKFASFSNWGPAVDWLAPGVDILGYTLSGALTQGKGTSYSAPHVTGALALLLQHKPLLTVTQAATTLSDAAKDKANTTIQTVPRTTTTRSVYVAKL